MALKPNCTLDEIDAEIAAVDAEFRQRLRHLRAYRKVRADEISTGQKVFPAIVERSEPATERISEASTESQVSPCSPGTDCASDEPSSSFPPKA